MKKTILSAGVIAFMAFASASAAQQQIPDAEKGSAPAAVAQSGSRATGNNAKSFARQLAHAISLIDEKQFDAAREELNALSMEHPDEPSIFFFWPRRRCP